MGIQTVQSVHLRCIRILYGCFDTWSHPCVSQLPSSFRRQCAVENKKQDTLSFYLAFLFVVSFFSFFPFFSFFLFSFFFFLFLFSFFFFLFSFFLFPSFLSFFIFFIFSIFFSFFRFFVFFLFFFSPCSLFPFPFCLFPFPFSLFPFFFFPFFFLFSFPFSLSFYFLLFPFFLILFFLFLFPFPFLIISGRISRSGSGGSKWTCLVLLLPGPFLSPSPSASLPPLFPLILFHSSSPPFLLLSSRPFPHLFPLLLPSLVFCVLCLARYRLLSQHSRCRCWCRSTAGTRHFKTLVFPAPSLFTGIFFFGWPGPTPRFFFLFLPLPFFFFFFSLFLFFYRTTPPSPRIHTHTTHARTHAHTHE